MNEKEKKVKSSRTWVEFNEVTDPVKMEEIISDSSRRRDFLDQAGFGAMTTLFSLLMGTMLLWVGAIVFLLNVFFGDQWQVFWLFLSLALGWLLAGESGGAVGRWLRKNKASEFMIKVFVLQTKHIARIVFLLILVVFALLTVTAAISYFYTDQVDGLVPYIVVLTLLLVVPTALSIYGYFYFSWWWSEKKILKKGKSQVNEVE